MMKKLKKIRKFESRKHEDKVDVQRDDKAMVELIMHENELDLHDEVVAILKKEDRVKHLAVETIPYFV